MLFVNIVGISSFISCAPAITSGSSFTASYAGLTLSLPNGSKSLEYAIAAAVKGKTLT